MLLRLLNINKNRNSEFEYLSQDLPHDRVGEVLSPDIGQYCYNKNRSIDEALEILKTAMIQSRLEIIQKIQADIDNIRKIQVRK